jgi:hypothetical protein
MSISDFSGYTLSSFAAVAMLAGCGGSQPATSGSGAMRLSVAMSHVRTTSGSEDCPALPGGTGILPDGDFSQATYPEQKGPTFKKGYVFAPYWEVSKGNIDFNGSLGWGGAGLDNLCSVDLDGYYKVGGIKTSAFQTDQGASYTLSFMFSGNGGGPPTVKTMKVEIDHQFTTFTWNISGGKDVQNNDYATETWKFTGGNEPAILTLISEDPKKSTYGPVVAGMAITKD